LGATVEATSSTEKLINAQNRENQTKKSAHPLLQEKDERLVVPLGLGDF
jgi:hypothetical protein